MAKFNSTFDIDEEILFLNYSSFSKKTCSNHRLIEGKINSVEFSKNRGSKISYDIQGNDSTYYSDVHQKYIFKTKGEAKQFIMDNFVKI